jgi:predicted ATPase
MQLKRIEIENFRCFSNFSIEGLERINLIAGMNNSGKTSLLEAIFIHTGSNNPQLSLSVSGIRGLTSYKLRQDELWESLFLLKNTNEKARIWSKDEIGIERTLELSIVEQTSAIIGRNGGSGQISLPNASSTASHSPKNLLYNFFDSREITGSARLYAKDGTIQSEVSPDFPNLDSIYSATRMSFPQEEAERFSQIAELSQESRLVEALKVFEPRLRKLTVLVRGGEPTINGDIGVRKLIPIQMMGEGIGRTLSILISIMTTPHGILLIDEIENGIHYSVLERVWKAIGKLAEENGVQIFATTHSWECIKAAHQAFRPDPCYGFRLHRLDRLDDEIVAVRYSKEALDAALESDLEVR